MYHHGGVLVQVRQGVLRAVVVRIVVRVDGLARCLTIIIIMIITIIIHMGKNLLFQKPVVSKFGLFYSIFRLIFDRNLAYFLKRQVLKQQVFPRISNVLHGLLWPFSFSLRAVSCIRTPRLVRRIHLYIYIYILSLPTYIYI